MSADGLFLTRDEVETLTGYIERTLELSGAGPSGNPNNTERAVLAKLEAVVTGPASGGEKHE